MGSSVNVVGDRPLIFYEVLEDQGDYGDESSLSLGQRSPAHIQPGYRKMSHRQARQLPQHPEAAAK